MNKNIYHYVMITSMLLALTGCGSTKEFIVKTVDVPIPVPCNIIPPRKPSMPFTDNALIGDMYKDTQTMLAEIELRKGYETELEAAITACNSNKIKWDSK